jgi:hypothetical protein
MGTGMINPLPKSRRCALAVITNSANIDDTRFFPLTPLVAFVWIRLHVNCDHLVGGRGGILQFLPDQAIDRVRPAASDRDGEHHYAE